MIAEFKSQMQLCKSSKKKVAFISRIYDIIKFEK